MSLEPTEPHGWTSKSTVNMGTNLNTLIIVVTGLVLLGINIGGAKLVLSQGADFAVKAEQNFKDLTTQTTALKEITLQQSFQVAGIQKELGQVSGQIKANQDDDFRQWETIRQNEARMKISLTREAFAEWRIEYERRNPGSIAPSLAADK